MLSAAAAPKPFLAPPAPQRTARVPHSYGASAPLGLALGAGSAAGAASAARKRAAARGRRRSRVPRGESGGGVVPAVRELPEWPAEVSGYPCRPVVAEVPGLGRLAALVIDDSTQDLVEEELENLPDWVPAAWLNPVVGDPDVGDLYGAIGVWPAASVAGQEVSRWAAEHQGRRWRALELGSGAGFPALVAASLGASGVLAVDTEPLPLALLQAAFDAQCQSWMSRMQCATPPVLETRCGDAREVALEGFDVVIVADLLYSKDLGQSLGRRLGAAVRAGCCEVILTDGERSGSDTFLAAFRDALGAAAWFEEVPVPEWAPACSRKDLFDGEARSSVRALRYERCERPDLAAADVAHASGSATILRTPQVA